MTARAGKFPRKFTKTSGFGSSTRMNHDASEYYHSRMNPGVPGNQEESIPPSLPLPLSCENKIFQSSSEQMQELPDGCLHLVVTSPPYNSSKTYNSDLSLSEYLAFLQRVFCESYRVLAYGGRACINVANLGRKPYIPLSAYISQLMIEIGFQMRGEIIWNKGAGAGISMAWGSWRSASNPVLRDTHEYILIFSKGDFQRKKFPGAVSTISAEQFMEWTKSVWSIVPESAQKVGHPAPFPVELPYRLIQLYTYKGDTVLDPFMGSGSTALACLKSGRKYIGYELDSVYTRLAEERIAAWHREHSETG
ncbi:MAG TPA: site-specific DNA-methyltransferase [Anaerolineaceae bacterium]